jgi:hypothetical protein
MQYGKCHYLKEFLGDEFAVPINFSQRWIGDLKFET